jgi:hypothetical protein
MKTKRVLLLPAVAGLVHAQDIAIRAEKYINIDHALFGAVVIPAGDSHGRALDFRGVVWPWGGQDEHGQLGNGGLGGVFFGSIRFRVILSRPQKSLRRRGVGIKAVNVRNSAYSWSNDTSAVELPLNDEGRSLEVCHQSAGLPTSRE